MDILKRIVSIIFFLFTLGWLAKAFFLGNYPDFNVFYGGMSAYLHGGDPYVDVEGSTMKFLYPPFALFFFYQLIFFPREVASVLWVGVSLILLVASLVLLFRISQKKLFSNEFLVLAGLSFLMFPVKFNLGMGQFNMVNLFLICLFLYFLKAKQDTGAAISLSLSLLLKVFPLLFLPYVLLLRKWKIVVSVVGITTFGLLLPYLFMDKEIVTHFFSVSIIGTIKSWPLEYYNQAFSGFVGRWLERGDVAQIIKLVFLFISLGSTAWILWMKRKHKNIVLLGFASLLPLTLATLSFSWQHYFVLTIPTFILIYFHLRMKSAKLVRYLPLVIAYFLIAANLSHPGKFPGIVQSHMLWGVIILWLDSLYELIKYD